MANAVGLMIGLLVIQWANVILAATQASRMVEFEYKEAGSLRQILLLGKAEDLASLPFLQDHKSQIFLLGKPFGSSAESKWRLQLISNRDDAFYVKASFVGEHYSMKLVRLEINSLMLAAGWDLRGTSVAGKYSDSVYQTWQN